MVRRKLLSPAVNDDLSQEIFSRDWSGSNDALTWDALPFWPDRNDSAQSSFPTADTALQATVRGLIGPATTPWADAFVDATPPVHGSSAGTNPTDNGPVDHPTVQSAGPVNIPAVDNGAGGPAVQDRGNVVADLVPDVPAVGNPFVQNVSATRDADSAASEEIADAITAVQNDPVIPDQPRVFDPSIVITNPTDNGPGAGGPTIFDPTVVVTNPPDNGPGPDHPRIWNLTGITDPPDDPGPDGLSPLNPGGTGPTTPDPTSAFIGGIINDWPL